MNNLKKITLKEFEELLLKDEELTSKAKEITGEGEELQAKVTEFAASLGYELVTLYETDKKKIDLDELDSVAGGKGLGGEVTSSMCPAGGEHERVFVRKVPGRLWGENSIYKCTKCGEEKEYFFSDWTWY